MLGYKIQALITNVEDLKSLIFTLQNRSCVTFYVNFKTLRFGLGDKEMEQPMHHLYSIFQFCDNATNQIIERIMVLAKKRVYLMRVRDQ